MAEVVEHQVQLRIEVGLEGCFIVDAMPGRRRRRYPPESAGGAVFRSSSQRFNKMEQSLVVEWHSFCLPIREPGSNRRDRSAAYPSLVRDWMLKPATGLLKATNSFGAARQRLILALVESLVETDCGGTESKTGAFLGSARVPGDGFGDPSDFLHDDD